MQSALPVIEEIIDKVQDSEALTHICWTLAYMSSAEEGPEKLAASSKLMRQLVQWMR